jgi:hypothetical protein
MKGGQIMPFINIKVLKGTLSKEKKDEMIKRVSETVAEIEASPSRVRSLGDWGECRNSRNFESSYRGADIGPSRNRRRSVEKAESQLVLPFCLPIPQTVKFASRLFEQIPPMLTRPEGSLGKSVKRKAHP